MIKWSRFAALTSAMALGLAASAQAAVATFMFTEETNEDALSPEALAIFQSNRATGTLVLKD